MQCNFDPKRAKTAQTRIFPNTTLPFDDSKQLPSVSDQVLTNMMCGFKENVQKPDFLAKMAKFWTKKRSKKWPLLFQEKKTF